MSWALLNLVVAITILPVALTIGDRNTRFAILVLTAGSVMAVAVLHDMPEAANRPTTSLVVVDLMVSAALFFLALTSNRHWPVQLPALSLVALPSYYIGQITLGELLPSFSVYRSLFTIPSLAIILMAALFANAQKMQGRDR